MPTSGGKPWASRCKRARCVALAGPFAGLVTAAGCLFLWQTTGNSLWAALAHAGAWLNLLNLIPVTLLDGGHAMYALDRTDRMIVLGASVVGFFWLHEGVYLLVAAGDRLAAVHQGHARGSDRLVLVDMLALLGLLGLVLHGAPDALDAWEGEGDLASEILDRGWSPASEARPARPSP